MASVPGPMGSDATNSPVPPFSTTIFMLLQAAKRRMWPPSTARALGSRQSGPRAKMFMRLSAELGKRDSWLQSRTGGAASCFDGLDGAETDRTLAGWLDAAECPRKNAAIRSEEHT